MNDYNVGDEFECTKDFYMDEDCGGERAFTTGKVYTITETEDSEGDLTLIDDADDDHMMDDRHMKKYFKKVKSADAAGDAYDRAMGIL